MYSAYKRFAYMKTGNYAMRMNSLRTMMKYLLVWDQHTGHYRPTFAKN